jgi:signal transduction histidine kinase
VIVAVSLVLNGVVTGYLVQQLQLQDAKDQLSKNGLLLRPQIIRLEGCTVLTGPCTPAERVTSLPAFIDNLASHASDLNLAGDRLIVMDQPQRTTAGVRTRQPLVLFDSQGDLAWGSSLGLRTPRTRTIAGTSVAQDTINLGGRAYLVSGIPIAARGGYASDLIMARPQDVVIAQTNNDLLTPLLRSAGIALLLAIVVALLISRAFTRPLRELKTAAEDIAGGNYARRVRTTGSDEVGVVGQAFNRMAEAVERTRSQQRAFLANVSHELKTPLTSLIGFSQALMDGSLQTEKEKARAAGILHEEAERVLRMSQELLDLARVEAGQLALNPHPVDLGVQLQQEIEIIKPRAEARGLVLQVAMPATLPPVQADPDRLHQILENLLDNAVKYAPERGNVWISTEAPDGRVVTTVRNRVGLRPPDPNRMFDRFYRGDSSRSSAGGVGLGLAICRELAMAQQGDLTAELRPDGSLALRLDLPAAAQPVPLAALPPKLPARLTPRAHLRS